MAADKTGTWSNGEPFLWYTPSSNLDPTWSLGESFILDEYTVAGLTILDYERASMRGCHRGIMVGVG